MVQIGERLKAMRHGLGLPQKAFAETIGLSQSGVNRYENNQSEAPYKALLAYADFFDVSLDFIFGRTDDPKGKLFDCKPKIEAKIKGEKKK